MKKSAIKSKARKGKGKGRRGPARKSQNTKVDARLTTISTTSINIGVGNGASNYVYGYFSALGNQQGQFILGFQSNADYQVQRALYDEVKITGYTVKFKPAITMAGVYDQAVVNSTTQTMLEPVLWTFIDRDGTALPAMTAQIPNKIGQYDSAKQHSCYKPISRHVRIKGVWLDTEVIAACISAGSSVGTTNLVQAGLFSCLGLYGQNLPWYGTLDKPEPYGKVEVHWHMCFRGKKPVNQKINEDGSVTITPMELYAPLQNTLTFVEVSDTSGTRLTFDGSGNPNFTPP